MAEDPTSRFMARWTSAEEKDLMDSLKSGMQRHKVAEKLHRKPGAINSRIMSLASKQLVDGTAIDQIRKDFDLSESEVKKLVENKDKLKEKKSGKKKDVEPGASGVSVEARMQMLEMQFGMLQTQMQQLAAAFANIKK